MMTLEDIMDIDTLYGLLVVAAFALFAISLAWVSETTEARLKQRDKVSTHS